MIPGELTLSVSREHVRILLRNLIENAYQHGVREATIEIVVAMTPTQWRIVISNHAGVKSGRGGHGLGLSIARQICRQQRWGMRVSEQSGTFRVTVHGKNNEVVVVE